MWRGPKSGHKGVNPAVVTGGTGERIGCMSEWGIALIAAGSVISGGIVTGFFAWKAGHRQAVAAAPQGRRRRSR
ncbi:hypothetical protein EDD98_7458 [Streptomyces sp. PanSC19]|nr:hypothetical protein EDD98_7458 [Streptomyces sp. PanSC19]